ncbi:cytochrome P450 [Hymenopellis radicata]|nr:cytochrome P450 [Hymenopellis radicata]
MLPFNSSSLISVGVPLNVNPIAHLSVSPPSPILDIAEGSHDIRLAIFHSNTMMLSTGYAIFASTVLLALFKLLRIGRRKASLPRLIGPPTIPLLGNLHVFPTIKNMHLRFFELATQYGDIMSLQASSQTVIILSSATAVKEIVDKTGWAASSRPPSHIPHLIAGPEHLIFASPNLRVTRKAISTYLSKQHASRKALLAVESAQLLHDLMENPREINACARRYAYSIMKTLAYGQRVPFHDSHEVIDFFQKFDAMIHMSSPGPMDLIPVLKYLPSFLAPWKAACCEINTHRVELCSKWSNQVKVRSEKRTHGEDEDCFMDWIHRTQPQLNEDLVSTMSLSVLDGGSDTTSAFLSTVILALASNPEHQKRAFEEIDSILGSRMPQIYDMEKLPFVKALLKEIHRLRPTASMGLPHAVTQDLCYKGYVIPKGATILVNIYAITNDPHVFENPQEFSPERFMCSEFGTIPGKDENFRDNFAFGTGRRICPGQWVASRAVELAMMRLIWALEFTDAVDSKTRRSIPPGLGADTFNYELVVTPRPFECNITPRRDRAHLIRDNFAVALSESDKFEEELSEDDARRMRQLKERLINDGREKC